MNDSNQEAFLKQIGISGIDIELLQLNTEEDML